MDNVNALQVDQIVSVWTDGLHASGYEDGIIRGIRYDHDEIEVELDRGFRMVSSADIEVPR